jgi:hypothetical protein
MFSPFYLPAVDDATERHSYRLLPTFTVDGPHDWLNRPVCAATLIAGAQMSPATRMAGAGKNDRTVEVHRPL